MFKKTVLVCCRYHIFIFFQRIHTSFSWKWCHGKRCCPSGNITNNELDGKMKEIHRVPLIEAGNINHLHKACDTSQSAYIVMQTIQCRTFLDHDPIVFTEYVFHRSFEILWSKRRPAWVPCFCTNLLNVSASWSDCLYVIWELKTIYCIPINWQLHFIYDLQFTNDVI